MLVWAGVATGCPAWADLLSSQDLQQQEEMCVGRIPQPASASDNIMGKHREDPRGKQSHIPSSLLERNMQAVSAVRLPLSFHTCSKCPVV